MREVFTALFLLLPLIFSPSLCCFSSGDPSKGNPEAEKLSKDKKSENEIVAEEKSEVQLEVDKGFVLEYLKEFGYLPEEVAVKEGASSDEINRGIKQFQQFMGLSPTGTIDLPTLARISWKRCSNPDEENSTPHLWERTTLLWAFETPPDDGFPIPTENLIRLIRQAFAAWEIVIALDFLEVSNPRDAHILFSVDDGARGGMPSRTGLGIAKAKPAPLSRIWLNKNENWSTFQTQKEGEVDIFLVLIHEIGHSLGLKHNGDMNSVMFPMFERSAGEQLPVISSEDVERLRALYASADSPSASKESEGEDGNFERGEEGHSSPTASTVQTRNAKTSTRSLNPSSASSASSSSSSTKSGGKETSKRPLFGEKHEQNNNEPEQCPHLISSATIVGPGMILVINGQHIWTIVNGNLTAGPRNLRDVFPDAPKFVNTSFASGPLTVFVQDHVLFGYLYDAKEDKFTRAKGFPHMLHNRILFYPQGSFPLGNGSIILLQGKVFATYNVENNTPHMLGNLDEFFPNLPPGLISGFPATPDFLTYYMLTPKYAFLYDVRLSRLISTQTIGQFLGCDPVVPMQLPKNFPIAPQPATQIRPASQPRQFEIPRMMSGQGPPGGPEPKW